MKKPLISLVLLGFCLSGFPVHQSLTAGYAASNARIEMTSIEPAPPNAGSYQLRAFVRASLTSNALLPLPSACFSAPTPQWEIKVTLTESAGVAARLTRMSIHFYDDNRVYTGTNIVEGSQLSSFFRSCGSDGINIPALGRLCGDFCISLGGRMSGAITLSFVVDDGRGLPTGDCTGGVILLGEKINQGADLSLTNVVSTYAPSATQSVSFVTSGFTFLHKITVTNNGPQTANNVVVRDIIESGATFQAIAVDKGQFIVPAVGTTGTAICTLGSMPPGTSASIWLFAKASSLLQGLAYNNLASVSSTTGDPNLDNNFADEAVSPDSSPFISGGRFLIVTTPLANSTALGTRIAYTIKVTNTGPESAHVSLANLLSGGTTFASATGEGLIFDKPPVGGTGVVLTFLELDVNQSKTMTITLNVLGGTGSTLGNVANIFLFEGATERKTLTACSGVPLQVSDGGSQSADVIQPGSIGISGGRIISIVWGVGSPSSGDPTPAPRLGGAAALSLSSAGDGSLPPSIDAKFTPSADPCTLIGYKLHIADNPAGVADAANVWKMLPPDLSSSSVPSAPSGSYYALVAVYRCADGTTRDSQLSNIISSSTSAPPRITGTPFRQGKHLYVPGDGFVDGAEMLRNEESLPKTALETSTLLRAKKAGKSTFSGDRIKVRNPDGSESNTVIYP